MGLALKMKALPFCWNSNTVLSSKPDCLMLFAGIVKALLLPTRINVCPIFFPAKVIFGTDFTNFIITKKHKTGILSDAGLGI